MQTKIAGLGLVMVMGMGAAAAPGPANAAGSPMPMGNGQDASRCVTLQDATDGYSMARLVNGCSMTIEVSWCTEGIDCQNGLSNMHTFGPGASYPVQGTGGRNPGRTVQWGACVGANTITSSGQRGGYACNAPY